jgi:hypothetical protein
MHTVQTWREITNKNARIKGIKGQPLLEIMGIPAVGLDRVIDVSLLRDLLFEVQQLKSNMT